MKLLYLFVKQFKCLENREFNFDSNIRFYYNDTTGKLDYVERHVVPEAFWTADENKSSRHDETPVESVSAIIGENGTGKTSIAALLHDLLSGSRYDEENETEGVNAILILLKEKNLLVKIAGRHAPRVEELFSNRKVSINGNNLVIRPVDKQEVDMIYYSPVFSVTRDEGKSEWNVRDRFFDISTTGLLRNSIREGFVQKEDPIKLHEADELRLVLDLLWNLKKKEINSQAFPQPLPRYVAIEPMVPVLAVAKERFDQFAGLSTRSKQSERIKKTLSKQFSRLLALRNPIKNPLVVFFYSFGVRYLAERLICQMKTLHLKTDAFSDQLFRVLEEVCDESSTFDKQTETVMRFVNNGPRPALSIHGQSLDFKPPLKTVFSKVMLLLNGNGSSPRIQVERGSDDWGDLMELVRLHRQCLACGPFLAFSFPSAVSSGELSFLSMFGRLSERFNELSRTLEKKRKLTHTVKNMPHFLNEFVHAVVFLDEAETSLHPEWQRKLVSHSISFFEKLHPNVRVHLIFASHSPIILSDIPKDNVIFLPSKSKGCVPGEGKNTSGLEEVEQTFGANIFDLYSHSFFLRDGPCGEFAKTKIDALLQAWNDLLRKRKPVEKAIEDLNERKRMHALISLLGDPVLHAYIAHSLILLDRSTSIRTGGQTFDSILRNILKLS